jgi:ABC-type thiamine transport system ATPase subunit
MIPKRGATTGPRERSLSQALRLAPKLFRHVLERDDGQRKWQNNSFSVRPSRRLKNPEQLDSDGVLLAVGLSEYYNRQKPVCISG